MVALVHARIPNGYGSVHLEFDTRAETGPRACIYDVDQQTHEAMRARTSAEIAKPNRPGDQPGPRQSADVLAPATARRRRPTTHSCRSSPPISSSRSWRARTPGPSSAAPPRASPSAAPSSARPSTASSRPAPAASTAPSSSALPACSKEGLATSSSRSSAAP